MSKREDVKEKILKRALVHVPFDGWTKTVLELAAEEEGLERSYSWRLFPRGPIDAVEFWSQSLDKEMLKHLPPPSELRTTEKITLATKKRISLLTSHKEAARKTARFLAKPQNAGDATRLLYNTVSEIWYYAGDTSTDYNFYTKRALLAIVYSSTLLYWLKDDSEDHEKSWIFLNRRIDNVLKIPLITQKVKNTFCFWKKHG
jgi:ubiquinone biosynthesis protein COQ9